MRYSSTLSVGFGKICRSVVDGDGQMAKFGGQPPGFARPARIFFLGKLFPAVPLAEAGHLTSQEADRLLFGERQQLDAVRDNVAGPVQLPGGNNDMTPGRLVGRYFCSSSGLTALSYTRSQLDWASD